MLEILSIHGRSKLRKRCLRHPAQHIQGISIIANRQLTESSARLYSTRKYNQAPTSHPLVYISTTTGGPLLEGHYWRATHSLGGACMKRSDSSDFPAGFLLPKLVLIPPLMDLEKRSEPSLMLMHSNGGSG